VGLDDFDGAAFAATLPWTVLTVVAVLGLTFLVALRVGRHAVIDVAWGLGFAAVALTAFLAATGDPTRAAVALAVTSLWGLRLAAHIGWRSRGKGEDPRYEAILRRAQGNPQLHALRRVYVPQAAIMWFVSLPVQVAMFSDVPPGGLLWAGVVVWAVGLFFETVGDWQLHRFRSDPGSRGKVLDTGLWRYTRHPNYFGDATAWWGIFLVAASGGPAGWLTLASPLVMTWLLARGTGKPLLEKDIAERRPEYAEYVRRTSGFVPWPPRRR
jgi:steroid 5-alpha reductase family enzyme